MRVFNLHSSFADMGIYSRIFWSVVSKNEWQWAFCGHAQPFLLIESLGYRICSSQIFLAVLQALLLSLPVFIFQRFARNKNKEVEYLVVIAYILYFPLWYNALFDFHMDHLAIVFGALFYLACSKKRWFYASLSAICLCMVKEPFALSGAFCGIYIFIKRQRILGLIVLLFGISYFYFSTTSLIPFFTKGMASSLGIDAFSWMGVSIFEKITFLITNVPTVIKEIYLNQGKIKYLICLFGALAFVSFLSPAELLPAIPILGISMLSRAENYFGIGNHYTAALIAPMIASFAVGLPRAIIIFNKIHIPEKAFCRCLIVVLAGIHIIISPSPLSRLFITNKVWSYGFEAYIPSSRNEIIKRAIQLYVPSDPNISVAVQNTVNNSHLAHRNFYFLFPEGISEPVMLPKVFADGVDVYPVLADYLVLDFKRPWYIKDFGCQYQNSEKAKFYENISINGSTVEIKGPLKWIGCAPENLKRKYILEIEKAMKQFSIIFNKDGFLIMKRK